MAARTDPKQQLIKRIHAQAREARMADDVRRDGMMALVGKASTADMDIGELHQVSTWLATRGGKVRAPKKPLSPGPSPASGRGGKKGRALSLDAQAQKLRAIWLELHQLGIVRDSSEAALCSWAANSRSPNVTTILGLLAGTEEMDRTIERLKQWRTRELCKGQLFCQDCGMAFKPTPAQARAFPRLVCDCYGLKIPYQWRPVAPPHPNPLPGGEGTEKAPRGTA